MKAPVVPDEIFKQISKHAHSTIRPMRESVGYLTVEKGVAVSYTRLRNRARGDYTFSVWGSDFPNHDGIVLVHSHPNGYPEPSDGDLRKAGHDWLGRPYGIFVIPSGYARAGGDEERLLFFRLWKNRRDWTPLV